MVASCKRLDACRSRQRRSGLASGYERGSASAPFQKVFEKKATRILAVDWLALKVLWIRVGQLSKALCMPPAVRPVFLAIIPRRLPKTSKTLSQPAMPLCGRFGSLS